jgi:hypothetical protein
MAIDKKLIDQLLTDYKKPEDIIGENGLLKELTKAILERALQAEMTDHLGYEKHDPADHHRGNSRNGNSQKTLKGEFGELELETPRDRRATFDPKIVAKGQTLGGLRRQDHLDVRAGDEHAGDPRPPGRDLQDRSLPDADFQRHRGGARRGQSLAEPARSTASRGRPYAA